MGFFAINLKFRKRSTDLFLNLSFLLCEQANTTLQQRFYAAQLILVLFKKAYEEDEKVIKVTTKASHVYVVPAFLGVKTSPEKQKLFCFL